jgi:Ca-activated chloride channel family protein
MIEQFLAPGRLWLLLAVAALAVAYVVLQRRRPAYAVRFTELDLLASVAPRSPGWRRHLPAGLLLLSLVALTVAFARPQAPVEVPSEQATIVLAIDTSLSMEATDVDPDRITAARVSASEFIDELPERFNVGLVSFSGQAAIVVPPTQDHASVTSAVQTLELGPEHRDRRGGVRLARRRPGRSRPTRARRRARHRAAVRRAPTPWGGS